MGGGYNSAMPQVSVIVAAYNAAPYIAQAIESVQAQTLQDWEMIIVDDASTDQTIAAVEPYLCDSRIRLIKRTENRGPSAARNCALDAAQGEWIAILDADDWYDPPRLERLLECARQLQVSLIYDLNRWVDGRTGEVRRLFFSSQLPTPSAPTRLTPEQAIYGHLTLKPVILRQLIESHALRYQEDIVLGEDFLFQTLATIAGGGCGICPEAYYNYRLHPKSTYVQHYFDLSQPLRMYTHLLSHKAVRSDKRLQAAVRRDFRRVILAHAYPQFTDALKRCAWKRAWQIYRTAPMVLPELMRRLPAALRRRLRGERTTYDWEQFR